MKIPFSNFLIAFGDSGKKNLLVHQRSFTSFRSSCSSPSYLPSCNGSRICQCIHSLFRKRQTCTRNLQWKDFETSAHRNCYEHFSHLFHSFCRSFWDFNFILVELLLIGTTLMGWRVLDRFYIKFWKLVSCASWLAIIYFLCKWLQVGDAISCSVVSNLFLVW